MTTTKFKSICVIGLGYVGLPTAAIFASNNLKVLGVDTNEEVVSLINKGRTHIIEPDLDKLVKKNVLAGNLKATQRPGVDCLHPMM